MDLLQAYKSDDGDDHLMSDNSSPDSSPPRLSIATKSAAPKVDDTMLSLTVADAIANKSLTKSLDPTQHMVTFNPTYDPLWAPIEGPAHPYAKDDIAHGMRNHKSGFVENASIAPFGDLDALKQNDAVSVYNIPQHEQKKRKLEKKEALEKDSGGDGEGEEVDTAEVDNPATNACLL